MWLCLPAHARAAPGGVGGGGGGGEEEGREWILLLVCFVLMGVQVCSHKCNSAVFFFHATLTERIASSHIGTCICLAKWMSAV